MAQKQRHSLGPNVLQPRRNTFNVLDQSRQLSNVPTSLRGVNGAEQISSTASRGKENRGIAYCKRLEGQYLTNEDIAEMVSGARNNSSLVR